jgi:hypothetical protein
MLAATIGSRPVGTPANDRARAYIVDQLRLYGYDVRVQEVDARRPELGLTAHVNNIIATRAGLQPSAIGLVSHYDSVPESPGGADDGIGVAVSLEAARVLASRANPRHALMVLMTDGEEAGLMGAAGLTGDRDVMSRLEAYVNVEATGSSGTALLFETGPGNAWIVKPWAASAPHPRGVSYAVEIYRRLPNDTDFSIFKRQEIPGLNFAVTGDSYAYHTARDRADRISDETLQTTGENVVGTIEALDAADTARRSSAVPTFFDVGGTTAVTWGPAAAWTIAVLSLAFGDLAWVRVLFAAAHLAGWGRWVIALLWTIVGVAIVVAALVLGTLAVRETRSVYHPWYAHPDRLFVFLVALGTVAAWAVARIGQWLPQRAHGPRHPMVVWSFALPVWILLAGVGATAAPAAGYLWTLPLLIAGLGLLVVPLDRVAVVRVVSVAVLAVAGTLWLRDTVDLLHFAVALLGRLPIITPAYAFGVLMLPAAVMVVPPLVAAVAATNPIVRPSAITTVLLLIVVAAGIAAYRAPAYTAERPQRRSARIVVDGDTPAIYEISSQEPGIDLHPGAPSGWTRSVDAPRTSIGLAPLRDPFVFRTNGPPPGPAPAKISAFVLTPVTQGTELSMTVAPSQPGTTVTFVLPAGIRPARTNLPGAERRGRWAASFVAGPSQGITWRASFPAGQDAALAATRLVVTSARYPGGQGWQSLPAWLPQDTTVWRMAVYWILAAPLAQVPTLR